MTLKSTQDIAQPNTAPRFPRMRRHKKPGPFTVLFTDERTGVVVHCGYGGHWPVGEFSDEWIASEFEDLPRGSSVTITQE